MRNMVPVLLIFSRKVPLIGRGLLPSGGRIWSGWIGGRVLIGSIRRLLERLAMATKRAFGTMCGWGMRRLGVVIPVFMIFPIKKICVLGK